jgi:hypothetical protein
MSNVVNFPSPGVPAGASPSPAILCVGTAADGVAFAIALRRNWLTAAAMTMGSEIERLLDAMPVPQAAEAMRLPEAFVRGFASELASQRDDPCESLRTQLSLTSRGLEEDTFYWAGTPGA